MTNRKKTETKIDFAAEGQAAGERFRILWPYSTVTSHVLDRTWEDLDNNRSLWAAPMTSEDQAVFFAAFRAAAGEPQAPPSVKK